MALRSNAYDHPAYVVPQTVGGNLGAGASANIKFVAWTTMVLKRVSVTATVGGTGAATDVVLVNRISSPGTATTSLANVGTWTAAELVTNHVTSLHTFTRGEVCQVIKGTDATTQYAVGLEFFVSPGADVDV